MQVSFLIPLYNCLALTQACVDSLQRTLPASLTHEIILIDDGSTDGTREWLTGLRAPFRVILNPHNLGYAVSNNRGAAEAQGECLVLLNNDLMLTPRWLEPLLSLQARLGERSGVIGNIQRNLHTGALDHTGISIDAKGKPRHDTVHQPWRNTAHVIAVTGACMLIRRDLWVALGGFNERFKNGAEDVDLCLRASQLQRVNAVANRSVIGHHVSSSPGRKSRDEENAFLLTRLWHDRLTDLATRPLIEKYLAENWGRAGASPPLAEAWSALAYWLSLRQQPPAFIKRAAITAVDTELVRWEKLFTGSPVQDA